LLTTKQSSLSTYTHHLNKTVEKYNDDILNSGVDNKVQISPCKKQVDTLQSELIESKKNIKIIKNNLRCLVETDDKKYINLKP
jgi:hypothetical protein